MNRGLNIGEIIEKLSHLNDDDVIRFDFGYAYPSMTFNSYRGYYEDVAIGFNIGNNWQGTDTIVKEFKEFMQSLIGAEWTGYKGGDFIGHKETSVWIANSDADGTSTIVTGIRDLGYGYVIIETGYED